MNFDLLVNIHIPKIFIANHIVFGKYFLKSFTSYFQDIIETPTNDRYQRQVLEKIYSQEFMVKVTLGAPCRFYRSNNMGISTVWQTSAFDRLVQVLSIGDLIFLKVGTLQFVFSNLMWIQTSVSLKPCPILDESSAWKGTFFLVFCDFFLKNWCPQFSAPRKFLICTSSETLLIQISA